MYNKIMRRELKLAIIFMIIIDALLPITNFLLGNALWSSFAFIIISSILIIIFKVYLDLQDENEFRINRLTKEKMKYIPKDGEFSESIIIKNRGKKSILLTNIFLEICPQKKDLITTIIYNIKTIKIVNTLTYKNYTTNMSKGLPICSIGENTNVNLKIEFELVVTTPMLKERERAIKLQVRYLICTNFDSYYSNRFWLCWQ